MLVADSSGILNDSVDNEDAVIDQGCDEEDKDDETIEEQPDFSLDGEHDLFSESEETDTSSTEDESTKTKGKMFCTGKYMNSKLHDLKILLPLPACKNTLHLEKAVGQDTDNDIWRDHLHVQAKCHLICFMHHTMAQPAYYARYQDCCRQFPPVHGNALFRWIIFKSGTDLPTHRPLVYLFKYILHTSTGELC